MQNSFECAFAQSNYNSEEAIIKEAQNYYDAGKYTLAAPLYAQLVSTHPSEAFYHWNYGICLLNSSKNKAGAVHHLEIAANSKEISRENIDYFLSKAYHQNYEFAKALHQLKNFNINSKNENKELTGKAVLLSSQCKNAQLYDFNAFDEFVITKEEMPEEEGINLYNFDNYSGKYLSMPEKFNKVKSDNDNFGKYVFLSSFGNTIVFSGPGKSDTKELFISRKKTKNGWSGAEQIKFKNPLAGDKITPSISADGDTIYFSWNGAKSIGGFDVFISVFDVSAKQWSDPENLGPPINSVSDDFYFMPSADGAFAYVNSTRNCEGGKINVIKIDLKNLKSQLPIPAKNTTTQQTPENESKYINTNDKQADSGNKKISAEVSEQSITSKKDEENSAQVNEAVHNTNYLTVNGLFYSMDEPLSMNAKITAVNQNDPARVFTAETNSKTGEYVLQLPSEGNYRFILEKDGYQRIEQLIELKKDNEPEISQKLIVGKGENSDEHFLIVSQSNKMPEEPTNASEVTYKIQIGAFATKSINEITEKFKAAGVKDIVCQSRENGVHVFYTGQTNDFFSAMNERKGLIEKGITDAFVVAFSGAAQISIEDALLKKK